MIEADATSLNQVVSTIAMNTPQANKVTVYYDGACPRCIRDRRQYEKLCGADDHGVDWFDISGKDSELRALGIDPRLALTELHIRSADGDIVSELDAYIFLMRRTPWLKPLAFLLALPLLKPLLAKAYHRSVERRLRHSGRL